MQTNAGMTAPAVPMDPSEITPADSPLRFEDVMASPVIERVRTPALGVGDVAFDFSYPSSSCRGAPPVRPGGHSTWPSTPVSARWP